MEAFTTYPQVGTTQAGKEGPALLKMYKILSLLVGLSMAVCSVVCAQDHDRSVDSVERPASATLVRDRLKAMLIGSVIGDAAGGPVEFQSLDKVREAYPQFKRWGKGERLNATMLGERAAAFSLNSYEALRPQPEPYAHWTSLAPAGTATDDTRHKILVVNALRTAMVSERRTLNALDLARAYVEYPNSAFIRLRPSYASLAREWLVEYQLAARWVLGIRDFAKAKPLSRLWGGLPTNAGQMALLPLAGLFPGDPEGAYRLAYEIGFMDVGTAKDINASLVAGLAVCLGRPESTKPTPAELDKLLNASILAAAPYGYGQIPWTERRVSRWLNLASEIATEADGRPSRLFEILNEELADDIKWEARVPLVVAFAVMRCCRYDPLASLQTCLEFGHDTDSYAQLIGAFLGAVYGTSAFPESMTDEVVSRFKADYGENIDEWVDLLSAARGRATK